MSISMGKATVIAALAFAGGVGAANLPSAFAGIGQPLDLSTRKFTVFVDEVRRNLVFGEEFSGTYSKTIRLSNGSRREIELTPMVHEGSQVIRFVDSGRVTYMPLNGTATNGRLVVQVENRVASRAPLKD